MKRHIPLLFVGILIGLTIGWNLGQRVPGETSGEPAVPVADSDLPQAREDIAIRPNREAIASQASHEALLTAYQDEIGTPQYEIGEARKQLGEYATFLGSDSVQIALNIGLRHDFSPGHGMAKHLDLTREQMEQVEILSKGFLHRIQTWELSRAEINAVSDNEVEITIPGDAQFASNALEGLTERMATAIGVSKAAIFKHSMGRSTEHLRSDRVINYSTDTFDGERKFLLIISEFRQDGGTRTIKRSVEDLFIPTRYAHLFEQGFFDRDP